MTRRLGQEDLTSATLTPGAVSTEESLGRYLIGLTYVAVSLLVVGVAILLASGQSPLAGGPDLDLARLLDDLRSFDAAGFLWLGLLAVIATPLGRVVLAALAFARQRDRIMLLVAVAMLGIIAVGVLVARAGTV